jgi:hypothetical protein
MPRDIPEAKESAVLGFSAKTIDVVKKILEALDYLASTSGEYRSRSK